MRYIDAEIQEILDIDLPAPDKTFFSRTARLGAQIFDLQLSCKLYFYAQTTSL